MTNERAIAPDLARGFMLLLIVLANTPWFLWARPYAPDSAHPPTGNVIDKVVQFVMITGVDMRVYPMFAFLLGYGMVQFHRARVAGGATDRQVRAMFRRRHLGLIVLGGLQATLLFFGDILGMYGVLGLLLTDLYFFRRDRTLKVWVGVWLAFVAVMTVLFLLLGWLVMASGLPVEAVGMGDSKVVNAQTSWLGSLGARLINWVTASLMMGVILPLTPAAIVTGWLAARRRVLEEPELHRRLLRRTAVVGLAVGWLGGLPLALQHVGILGLPAGVWWMLLGWHMLTGFFAGMGYVAVFGLIAARLRTGAAGAVGAAGADGAGDAVDAPFDTSGAEPQEPRAHPQPGPVRTALTAVGRRSLTSYLGQSVLFAPLLAGWGLGLGGRINSAVLAVVAVAVWLVTVVFALWLERTGRRGPFEVVLRWFTYGRAGRPAPAPAPASSMPGTAGSPTVDTGVAK